MISLKYTCWVVFTCIVLISACDSSQDRGNNNSLFIQPTFNGQPLSCRQPFMSNSKSWRYTQFQFFISAIQLQNKQSKEWYSLSLLKTPYQTKTSALLGEYCGQSTKDIEGNWSLSFDKEVNFNEVSHIRFILGLPFHVNHLNPLTQESPLNIPSMFWGWQKGHKFLRLELAENNTNGSNNENWLFHLGSIGCNSQSPLRAPKEECRYPNRFMYELPITSITPQIEIELSALIDDVILSQDTSCQSSPGDISCQTLFNNLQKVGNDSIFRPLISASLGIKGHLNE